jgi:hypothetical protein
LGDALSEARDRIRMGALSHEPYALPALSQTLSIIEARLSKGASKGGPAAFGKSPSSVSWRGFFLQKD